jgi:hypothetical protein
MITTALTRKGTLLLMRPAISGAVECGPGPGFPGKKEDNSVIFRPLLLT